MILNLLKESLKLNEAINLDQPDIKTTNFAIYELTEYTDLDSFTAEGVDNIGDAFGLTQANWNGQVANGNVKPFMVTPIDSNECVGMFLLWRQQMQFHIRGNKNLALPICFESINNHDVNTAYSNFQGILPLYTILDKYRDFTGYDPDNYITNDGQYINDHTLYGIFEEFFRLDENGETIYPPSVNLNQLGLNTLGSDSISYSDMTSEEDIDRVDINFYDNLTDIAEDAIADDYLGDGVYLNYVGDENELPEVFNNLPENIRHHIQIVDNEEIQQRRAQRAAEREAEAQAERDRIAQEQEAADRETAQAFDDEVIPVFDTITADDYVYDHNLDDTLFGLLTTYNHLTDRQKQLQTTNGNLQIAINTQNKKHAQSFIYNCNQKAFDEINSRNYEYNSRLTPIISSLEDAYNQLDNGVKNEVNELGFVEILNNVKAKQEDAKNAYQAEITKQAENDDIIVYDNRLLCKQVGNTIHIVGGKKFHTRGEGGDLIIPDRINNLPVTTIEKNAFMNNKSFNSIKLPSTIRSIGSNAFYNCGVKIAIPYDLYNNDTKLKQIQLASHALDYNVNSHYFRLTNAYETKIHGWLTYYR